MPVLRGYAAPAENNSPASSAGDKDSNQGLLALPAPKTPSPEDSRPGSQSSLRAAAQGQREEDDCPETPPPGQSPRGQIVVQEVDDVPDTPPPGRGRAGSGQIVVQQQDEDSDDCPPTPPPGSRQIVAQQGDEDSDDCPPTPPPGGGQVVASNSAISKRMEAMQRAGDNDSEVDETPPPSDNGFLEDASEGEQSDDGIMAALQTDQDDALNAAANMKEELAGLVEVNSRIVLSLMAFSVLWAVTASALLLALTWHYVWIEAQAQADLAAGSAIDQGRLQASEVLSPATTLVKTLDLAYRGEILNATEPVTEYGKMLRMVEPFFQSTPYLFDVEIADGPEFMPYYNPGSVLIGRTPEGGIEVRSDRGDCVLAPGGRACTLEPLRANGSAWYGNRIDFYPKAWNAAEMEVAWLGPSFGRDLPHEAICDELCWRPTYSFAARISGNADPVFFGINRTYNPFRSMIARVTVEAAIFIDVLKQIQTQSSGEAFICTAGGTIVATSEMSEAMAADPETGAVKMLNAWQYPRGWANEEVLSMQVVKAGDGESMIVGDQIVSVWKLKSPFNATAALEDSLRIVIAVPSGAFADSVLQSMRFWFIAVAAMPVVFLFAAAFVNIYTRFCTRRGARQFKDMTLAELKAMNKKRLKAKKLGRSKSFMAGGRSQSRLFGGRSMSFMSSSPSGDQGRLDRLKSFFSRSGSQSGTKMLTDV